VKLTRHTSWESFAQWRAGRHLRLVLFTTGATTSYLDHRYEPRDILLFGRESAGVPEHVHAAADLRLRIPMQAGLRSLNVAMTCAMAVGEALRQMDGFARG
jgi:tRNA (cytidine/uridine-2'-O-)-methyltransferase